MENISIQLDQVFGFVPQAKVEGYASACEAAQQKLHDKTGKGSDFIGWLNLPSSITQDFLADLQATADSLRQKCEVVVVAGIGGSYLGAKAVIEALGNSLGWLQADGKNPIVLVAGHNISEDYLY